MSGSGGANKKKLKTQGWEEAGAEFYQESYPTGEGELDFLQKDPQHLATLLPSKQTRAATLANTTARLTEHRTATRRRQSTRNRQDAQNTHRKSITNHDVQVSMLPDLSENISNEENIWDEIMEIKAIPVSMAQKKEMKNNLLNQPNLRLQGYEHFKWKRKRVWKKFQLKLSSAFNKLELWHNDLRKIEGHLGTGVVSYFLFIKWLFYLNIFICIMIFLFIALPYIVFTHQLKNKTEEDSFCANSSSNISVLDLIQGTGFMQCTYFFYGFYPSEILNFTIEKLNIHYDLSLAYVLTTFVYIGLSLIVIVRAGAKGFKERLIEGEGQFYLYCNLVFAGWDFCIHNAKSAAIKHKAIYQEIKASLELERLEEERQNRTRNEKTKLFLVRFLVNTVVITILIFCGCLIYFVFDYSSNQMNSSLDYTEHLIYEFLPSVTIVLLNIVIPILFRYLIIFERYSQIFVVRLTLIRTVFLRMASLLVLYATLYSKISCTKDDVCQFTNDCWETYVGQQIYKLFLTHFATNIFVTFFINLPRGILARHFQNNFIQFIGAQTFDLPKNTLDLVYAQSLVWLGCFYAPMLALVGVVYFCVSFYIKKFSCLVNSKPGVTIYRASKSNSMFMIVLLISYTFAVLPLAFSISELVPSKECGPFSKQPFIWHKVEVLFHRTPNWLKSIISFLTTAGFAIPVLIILCLLLYYYTAINSANRHMVKVLKNQLVLEGHDKQFLLDRLSMFIKQQQENQKRLRRSERECDESKQTD